MTRAERLARMRAIVDDLRARGDAAMKDLGSDGSPGAYFTGYASIALQELDAVLLDEERLVLEAPRLARVSPRGLHAPRVVGVGGVR